MKMSTLNNLIAQFGGNGVSDSLKMGIGEFTKTKKEKTVRLVKVEDGTIDLTSKETLKESLSQEGVKFAKLKGEEIVGTTPDGSPVFRERTKEVDETLVLGVVHCADNGEKKKKSKKEAIAPSDRENAIETAKTEAV